MKRAFVFLFLALLIPAVAALNLNVEKTSSDEVLILGLNEPAIFSVDITNNGAAENLELYTFFGAGLDPKETIPFAADEKKSIELKLYPRPDQQTGYFTFDYYIKGQTGEQKESLTVKIINFNDAFKVGAENFNVDDNSVNVYLKNRINHRFNDLTATFKSPFFEFSKTFSLTERETRQFQVKLNKEDFKQLMAGFYTMTVGLQINNETAEIGGTIEFPEKDLVVTKKNNFGFVINTYAIEKTNEGNKVSQSETVIRKNIISRLFTTFSPEPDVVERKGIFIYYTWNREISPGETLEIITKTNWLFPLLIVFFIVVIVVLAKKFSMTALSLKKKVTFVRANGGEFALKVTVVAHARKYIERVHIIDRIPHLVRLHESFGTEKPKSVDESSRRIKWEFEKMEAGEIRVLSYLVYSKVGVLGRFSLPTATAVYQRAGKGYDAVSNHAYFIAEQSSAAHRD
jgi:hypothetical protein